MATKTDDRFRMSAWANRLALIGLVLIVVGLLIEVTASGPAASVPSGEICVRDSDSYISGTPDEYWPPRCPSGTTLVDTGGEELELGYGAIVVLMGLITLAFSFAAWVTDFLLMRGDT